MKLFSNFIEALFGRHTTPLPGNVIAAPGNPITSGKVVAITLEPHTIATIFGVDIPFTISPECRFLTYIHPSI